MLYAIVAVLVIIVDQWVKYWVSGSIALESTGEAFIPGIISLVNLHNDGAAFSFLSGGGARIYFIILTGVFTVAVILALATRFVSGKVARWSLVLVTAGGLSNCIDRVIYGYVQDMFKLELFNFPVFNVADIFITVFCLFFVIAIIFEREPKPELAYDDEFEDEDDEEDDRPSRRRDKESKREKNPKKSRKAKYEDEYEQYKASRAVRQQQTSSQPAVKAKSNYDAADPFAEWERANARVDAQQKNSYAAKASGVTPSYSASQYSAQKTAAQPQQQPRTAPDAPKAPVQQAPVQQAPVQQPRPVQPAAAQAPAPAKTAAKLSGDKSDFSLDDILDEFK